MTGQIREEISTTEHFPSSLKQNTLLVIEV